jgi:hypothetical protein
MKLKLTLKFKSFLFFSFFAAKVFAAACCGGGFAAPSIISSDDEAQFTSSVSNSEIIVDSVDSQGIWRKNNSHQNIRTLKIEVAHVFWDRYQAALSIPVIQRSLESMSYSGPGDIATSLAYEYLPDWNYNPWRPKGIGYLQITLPTGKSRAESDFGGLDSRGNGFWALGGGTLFTKTWSRWDAFFSLEMHRSFGKEISNTQVSGHIEPGVGSNLGFGFGYNLKDYRIGSGIIWTYEDPIKNNFGFTNIDSAEKYATASLSLSYLANDEWAGTINYTDQTIFGSPLNTSLARGIALQLQRRWGR